MYSIGASLSSRVNQLELIRQLPTFFLYLVGGLFLLIFLVSVFRSTYTIVPPHLAHVVVSGKGRRVYMSRDGFKPQYYYLPILQMRNIMPLENIKIEISDIALRDINVARFKCDIVCWVIIQDPLTAAERIGEIYTHGMGVRDAFSQVEQDVRALIESVARTATMKIEIIELMKDRKTFSETVEQEIDVSLKKWGLELIDLEILDFHDDEGYAVIRNLEAKRAKEIEAESREVIAQREKEAAIAESNAQRETELTIAENRESYTKRQIEADQEIAMSQQDKDMAVAQRMREANIKQVEANRELEVGNARVTADADVERAKGAALAEIQRAEGEAQAIMKRGNAEAEIVRITGKADADSNKSKGMAQAEINQARLEADAAGNKARLLADAEGVKAKLLAEAEGVQAKLEAEAEGKSQLAEALKLYEESALTIESLYAARDIEISKYKSLGEALKAADLKIITSGEKEILGIPIGAETGASILGMINALKESGVNLGELAKMAKDRREEA